MPAVPVRRVANELRRRISKVIDDKPVERDSFVSVSPKEKEAPKTETPGKVKPADTTVA
jgi:hypothetical protein